MRLVASLCLSALASLAHAASDGAHLFLYQPESVATPSSRTVSPDTARMVMASRLGLDRFHELANADDEALRVINDLGGKQDLFAASSNNEPVAVVLANGPHASALITDGELLPRHDIHQLSLRPAPNARKSAIFFEAMAKSSHLNAGHENDGMSTIERTRRLATGAPTVFGHDTYQSISTDEELKPALKSLSRQGYTILILVPTQGTTSTGDFGNFDLPPHHRHKRQAKEALLADTTFDDEARVMATLTPTANYSTNYSTPLRGILPQCFSSMSTCQSVTRNCTGHGACTLRFTDLDASDSGAPCYTCSCTSQVRTNPDGTTKTTSWGGPACQKKDVVMPFWLLAGFSVFMVSLVGWGIGMLYDMGSQELPSVIGAGVSGVPHK